MARAGGNDGRVRLSVPVPSDTVGAGHTHARADPSPSGHRVLALVLAITVTVLVAGVVGAVWSGSLALLADAGHALTDAAGLALALGAALLTRRPATAHRTWGYRRAEVLAAAVQAAVLLAVGVFVLVEGIRRLADPPTIVSGVMLTFGVIGLAGNLVAGTVLWRTGRDTFNLRAAFLEVVNDALGSLAVIVAAIVVMTTGWQRADAVVSIVVGVLIVPRTVKLLRETVDVLLESAPRDIDLDQVRAHILETPHVHAVHDLHASLVASGLPVLTAHVVVDDSCFRDGHAPQLLDLLQSCLTGHFDVEHSTFQLEPASHVAHEVATHV